MIKDFIRKICPPILIELFKRRKKKYGFFGDYKTWTDAEQECAGYDSVLILEKVKQATSKVKSGEAVFERDSVIFDQPDFNYALLACLLQVASFTENKLRIIDFGGSLGSTYFQCRGFLSGLKELEWSIIEQPHFVECGKQWLENEQLQFFYNIDDCLQQYQKNVILLSSVIQYMDKPYDFIGKLLTYNLSYILIDRTPLCDFADRITIQKVSPSIYEASYPAYFLNKKKMIGMLETKYKIVAEWNASDEVALDDTLVRYKGMLLRAKEDK